MKKIGLLGGMSWESSVEYERQINRAVRERLGGNSSADLLIRSFNFADLEALQVAGKWDEAAEMLAEAAVALQTAGAEAILICANTMHVAAEVIQSRLAVPVIHVADVAGSAIQAAGVRRVLLLGTRYTMEKAFYKDRLTQNFGLEVATPEAADRDEIQRITYEELVRGILRAESREYLLGLIERFKAEGIEGVIAGCTEIELLVKAEDVDLKYFPTAALHARAAVDFALS